MEGDMDLIIGSGGGAEGKARFGLLRSGTVRKRPARDWGGLSGLVARAEGAVPRAGLYGVPLGSSRALVKFATILPKIEFRSS